MRDLALIVALAAASCSAVGLVGLAVLRALRGRPLRLTVVVAASVPVLAVAVSVVVNVRAMVISSHDSRVVLVALGCALVIALGLTLAIGQDVAAAARALSAGLQRLGTAYDAPAAHSGERTPAPPWTAAGAAPAELAVLDAELEATRLRLEESSRRERALEASRRELVAFMSHDLRTPLTGLRALAEGMEDGVIDDLPAALTRIRSTVDRMSSLVDDLFELSRVTAEGPARQRRLVSLAEIAMDVAGEAGDHARSQGVEVRLELASARDRLPVLGDGDELARALANLVANAVRHTARGGDVVVAGDRGDDGQVRMAVTDRCGGIPHDDLARVFDVGWRGSPDRTPDDGGAGLGLAIARGVAQAHDGSIRVRNVEGGCRFELALPTAR